MLWKIEGDCHREGCYKRLSLEAVKETHYHCTRWTLSQHREESKEQTCPAVQCFQNCCDTHETSTVITVHNTELSMAMLSHTGKSFSVLFSVYTGSGYEILETRREVNQFNDCNHLLTLLISESFAPYLASDSLWRVQAIYREMPLETEFASPFLRFDHAGRNCGLACLCRAVSVKRTCKSL